MEKSSHLKIKQLDFFVREMRLEKAKFQNCITAYSDAEI